MPETLQSFLPSVEEAALLLDESQTVTIIGAVKEQIASPKLRILIAGSPGSGRFALANAILAEESLLPVSSLPKAALPLRIVCGEPCAEVVRRDGMTISIPLEKLRSFLTDPALQVEQYSELIVRGNAKLLKTSDLTLAAIGAEHTEAEWRTLLAGTDYVILLLRASALWSEQEKRFVRDILQPSFGLQRVAIALNHMQHVPENERASIVELGRAFLGDFEAEPLMLELSGRPMERSLEGSVDQSDDLGALLSLVREDLVERQSKIKGDSIRQAVASALDELARAATRQQALLETNAADLQHAAERLNAQDQRLQERIARAQNRVDVFVSTLIKEEFLRNIEGFSTTLREQLPGEVMAVDDVMLIRRHLPGYIEALWQTFFQYQLAKIRGALAEEMRRIGELVRDDLRELLGDAGIPAGTLLAAFDPTPANMETFVMPRRGSSDASTIATGLQFGGLTLLLFGGGVLGLAAIGAGQLIRMASKKSVQAAEKQAIVASALETTIELERQIKDQVTGAFASLAGEMKQAVTDLYQQEIARVRTALQDSIARHAEIGARRGQLTELATITLPALRDQLRQIGAPVEAR